MLLELMSSVFSVYMRHLDILFEMPIRNFVDVFIKFDRYHAIKCIREISLAFLELQLPKSL